MFKQISLFAIALTALTATPATNITPTNFDAKSVLYFRFGVSGNAQKDMFVTFSNRTASPAKLTIEMYDADGKLIEVPYIAQDGGVTRLTRATVDVAPSGSGVMTTAGKNTKYQFGWLRVLSQPAGAVSVVAHGRTSTNGGPSELEYTLHAAAGSPVQMMGPFDNGSKDHFMLANNSTQADQVTLIARDRAGAEMCRASVEVGTAQYYKRAIVKHLPCMENKTGTLEARSASGATAALVFIYPDSGAAIPIEPQPAAVSSGATLEESLQDLLNRLKKTAGW